MRARVVIVVVLLFTVATYAEEQSRFEIQFEQGSHIIEPTLQHNIDALDSLSLLLDALRDDPYTTLTSIEIDSYTSPEGGVTYNRHLSQSRTHSIYQYIKGLSLHPLPDSLFILQSSGIWWSMLRTRVADSQMPYRDEVLEILDNSPEEQWGRERPQDRWLSLLESRNGELMSLRAGVPYLYMMEHIFPFLRQSSVVTIYFRSTLEPATYSQEVVVEPCIESASPPIAPLVVDSSAQRESRWLLALKTNLLYDLLLMPNIELEIPLSSRWSLAGEVVFPWWVTRGGCSALELFAASLELRYWFAESEQPLTGWFVGLYGSGGFYDMQRRGKGYQGEFFIPIALGGGYAHTINRSGSLRMEYSLGFGYLQTNYRYYNGCSESGCLKWQRDGVYHWVGPTRVEVSLVWMIKSKRR